MTRFPFHTISFGSLTMLSALALGCTDSHVAETDAGVARSDAASAADAPSLDAPSAACRLSGADGPHPSAGEGCFCDGPFVARGDLAYRLSFELEVIDLSPPSGPVRVGAVPQQASFASDLVVVGDVLFAAGGVIERFDLSSPRAPTSLGLVSIGGNATALAADGDRLAAGLRRDDGTIAIVPIDAGDPDGPIVGAPIELGRGEIASITRAGEIAFAVISEEDASTSLVAVDLAEGAALDRVEGVSTSGNLTGLVVLHGYVFSSDLSRGVSVYDATDPSSIEALDGAGPSGPEYVLALSASGDHLIVMGEGAWLYDASIPTELVPLGHVALPSDASHAAVLDDRLVISGGNGLIAIPLTCE